MGFGNFGRTGGRDAKKRIWDDFSPCAGCFPASFSWLTFTAVVTASLTVQQLQGDIRGPDDLPGKRVATTIGSTSATFLRTRTHVAPIEYSNIEQAYDALLKHQADAVVFDSPVLLYYATRDGAGKVQVVGTVFRKEDYGIVFPRGSAWRKPVNEALLRLRENGQYQTIYDKWFSTESGN